MTFLMGKRTLTVFNFEGRTSNLKATEDCKFGKQLLQYSQHCAAAMYQIFIYSFEDSKTVSVTTLWNDINILL